MNKHMKKLWLLPLAGLSLAVMPSCTTDAYGNTAVTPEGAAAIGVGAAILGGVIGNEIGKDNARHHGHRPPPPPRHYHR